MNGQARSRRVSVFVALLCSLAAEAGAQGAPVVFEMAGAGDARWEAIQLELGNLHIAKQLPLSIGVVPCTQATPPGVCSDDGSLRDTYRLWTHAHPTVIEVGQQGRDNTESLATLGPLQQRSLIEEGMNALLGWGLANGQPLFFIPSKSSANADTTSILNSLEYQTFSNVAGGCPAGVAPMDGFCSSVPLCQRTSTGGRVYGPDCELRSFADLAAEIDSRAAEGGVMISFMPQDFSVSTSNQAMNTAKRDAYAALLGTFARAERLGRYELRTFDTHYRLERGLPLPEAQPTPLATPTPSVPPPTNLPVVFTEDDPEDGTWEAATILIHDLFISERVPLVQQTVPCGAPSPTDGSECINTGFHERYAGWVAANPDLLEISQHGITHDEVLDTMPRAEQLELIRRGLEEMSTWGLPGGRPYTFAPPFSALNADTVSVLEELGFHTYEKNAGSCVGSDVMDGFCDSVPICELDAQGKRTSGPACVFKAPETLIHEVNARQGLGKVFLNFHVQDIMLPDLFTIDQAKVDGLRAIIQAFRDEETAGRYDLMTMDTYYRMTRGLPTPGPGGSPTPTPTPTLPPPTETATPLATETPLPTQTPTVPVPTATPPPAAETSPPTHTPTQPAATQTPVAPTPTPPATATPTQTPVTGVSGAGASNFLGDARDDLAFFRPASAQWFADAEQDGSAGLQIAFGQNGDLAVPGDYDGNGTLDLAVFRPATARWFVDVNRNGGAERQVTLGAAGDLPVPADYNGDGSDDFAVFRPSTGDWLLGNGALATVRLSVRFGQNGDVPVPADYDGNGRVDLAVFRPATGQWLVDVDQNGTAERTITFGANGDLPVPGDYNGDGAADFAVFRKASGTWLLDTNRNGSVEAQAVLGTATDIPAPNDFDGDGVVDIGVFQPSQGRWLVSSTRSSSVTLDRVFGQSGDRPIRINGWILDGMGLVP